MTRPGWRFHPWWTVLRLGIAVRRRSTLRLRLTAVNAILLVAAGVALMLALETLTAHPAWGWVALAVITAVGVAAAYLMAGRALRPLRQVTATARRLGEETLHERIGYQGRYDEVAELAGTFDAMLARLEVAFDSQQHFVANASHELRTPLAVIRTEVDVTLADPHADAAELRRMAEVVRDASTRANNLVDALLVLARTEAQAGAALTRREPADLAESAAQALADCATEIAHLSVRVHSELAPAPVTGDPDLIDRLAVNLVQNAVRYNHLHGEVRIATGADPGTARAWLVVRNTGFEVTPAELPTLFEPFRRGGAERTGDRGAGLGLSIVRAVCAAHGGTVGAVPGPAGGLEVRVDLPAAVA